MQSAKRPYGQTIIRFSSTWWIYMLARGGILRATVNGVEDALAITGRTLLLIYLVYCGAKAGAFLVAPDFHFEIWLEMTMFVLQLGGLEGSIPGLARRTKALHEAQDEEGAEKVKKVMLSARLLTIACMAEGALHALGVAGDAMKYVSAVLLVVRGIVITGFLIELAKMDSEGPRVLSRNEHEREREAEQLASEQAQTIADLQGQLEVEQQTVSSLRVQLGGEQQTVSSLRVQLNNTVSTVQSEVDREVSSLRVQLDSAIAELDSERQKVSTVQLQLSSATTEVDTLRVQLDTKENQLTSLKQTMASGMKWHESNTQGLVSSVQLQLDREREKVSSLQKQLDSAIAELDSERKKVSSVQLTAESVQLQMDREVSRLKAELDTRTTEVDTLRVQLDSLKVESRQRERKEVASREGQVIQLDTSRIRKNGQDDSAIGEQIRDLLKTEPGLSGRAIATRVGCSPTTASKWKELIEKERKEA